MSAVKTRLRRASADQCRPAGAGPQRLLFLVPAHNEATLIHTCVRSLLRMRRSAVVEHEVVVVADNCSDDTAGLAAAAGAGILERDAPDSPGKPRAIQWALQHVDLAHWDAVVIVDADTIVTPAFAEALAARGSLRDKAVQAYFGVSNRNDSWLSLLADLLAKVRYEEQYPLKRAAGLNCPLTGNGMCLGVELLGRVGWDTDSLTENWELYARYSALGEEIDYARDAKLYAQEARTLAQSSTQRRRWQAGRWSVLVAYARRLLTSSRAGGHQTVDTLGELAAPGPILHATVASVLALALLSVGSPVATCLALLFLLGMAPTAWFSAKAWRRHPQRAQLLLALLRLPVYAGWRVVVGGLALATARNGTWQRSPRHPPGHSN
jgi:cellulose synthase/poly-beta-1,6-N-acetylglucosamine synthase-like glycosyltransferase